MVGGRNNSSEDIAPITNNSIRRRQGERDTRVAILPVEKYKILFLGLSSWVRQLDGLVHTVRSVSYTHLTLPTKA